MSKQVCRVPIDEELPLDTDTSIVDVDRLLSRLGEVKPEFRGVVEMKVFQGLTADEIAVRLGCASVTVNRYWQFARKWLRSELIG